MTPIGDTARRIASYTEGAARLNVYKAARDELAALEARATAAEVREAKLRAKMAIIADGMPQTMNDGTVVNAPINAREAQHIAAAALETDNG
jgi:hypothetical protein